MNSNAVKCMIVLLVLALGLPAQKGPSLQDSQFSLHGFKAGGVFPEEEAEADAAATTWEISGESGWMQGELVQLRGFLLKLHNPQKGGLIIRSPGCEFQRGVWELKSDDAMLLQADGLQASGLGYDVYRKDDKLMLVVRSTVHIRFHKGKIKNIKLN